jgi:ribonuclease E/ribonuclease G
LRQAVAADPTPTHILGATALGLVELTRERRHAGLAETMLDPAASQRSAETIALAALRLVLAETRATGRAAGLACAPEIARRIEALPGPRAEAEARLGQSLILRPDSRLARESVEAVPL